MTENPIHNILTIAYLIAAHGNYGHLQRLINALQDETVFFYIHIDRKSPMPELQGDRIEYIKKRVDVHWSGFSQVQAGLNLMEAAVQGHYDYYAYISGVDYPIKPNEWLRERLAEGGEYMHINRMGEDPFAPLSRYKYYYFTDYYDRRNKGSYRTRFFLWFQKGLRSLRISKSVPIRLFTGAQWFVLSHACVVYILTTTRKEKLYERFFKTGFCPDEGYFQTIVGNSDFYKHIRGYLSYADWTVNPGPALLDESYLPKLAEATEKFFARKFTDDSAALTGLIDQQLRIV